MDDLHRFQHPRFARRYLRISEQLERAGGAELRREVLAGLHGTVLDLGCGNGKNFGHYPPMVRRVIAVEPDETLRSHAERAAATARTPVQVVPGHADQLPVEDGSVDAVVVTLVLCSVPDQSRALAEIHRALRPGGELRLAEHVRARGRLAGALQDAVTPWSRRLDGNCHQNRDTTAALRRSPLQVTRLRRFGFPVIPLFPGLPMVVAVAVKVPPEDAPGS